MTNSSHEKGARAEREVAALLTDLLGVACRRRLGAGRLDDIGDLDGLADTVIQVADRPSDTLRACWEKPIAAEQQRANDGASFAATFVRFPRRGYRVVLSPEQFAALWREATG